MTEEKKPETLDDQDLDAANGGITLDNGIKNRVKIDGEEKGPKEWIPVLSIDKSSPI